MIINEYPFICVMTHNSVQIYNGKVDVSLLAPENGSTAQTSDYVVSMPLTKDADGNNIIPTKNDEIVVDMYGDTLTLVVNNYIVSQLGGITIYTSRGVW